MEDIGCATRCGRDYDCDVPAYRCDITTLTCVPNRDGGVD
jgi:hypothetical protein